MDGYGIDENCKFYPVSLHFGAHRLCGSGRFSNVYCAQMTSPMRKEVAVKNLWTEKELSHLPTHEQAEVEILAKLFHPAISNLWFFYSKAASDKMIHCLVLDYLPSEMAKLRDQGVKFDSLDARLYSFQLFAAIAHLACKNIVHMDVKPQNVILDQASGQLKLADFGNARRLDTCEKTGGAYQVTRFYRPPELLFGCEIFSPAIDVWSATCVAFELFANRVLFRGRDTKDQINLITSVFGYPTDEDMKSIGTKRPRVVRREARGIETYTSRLLDAETYQLLKSTLKIDPKKRKSAADVLKLPFFDAIRQPTRRRRSNGSEIPDLSQYTDLSPKRPTVGGDGAQKVEKKTRTADRKKEDSSDSSSPDSE